MIIGIDWVIVCDLISLFGGIMMGVALMRPHRSSGPRDRLY